MSTKAVPTHLASWERVVAARRGIDPAALRALVHAAMDGIEALRAAAPAAFDRGVLGELGYACVYCVACQYEGATELILEATREVPGALRVALERVPVASGTASGGGSGGRNPHDAADDDARLSLLFELVFYRGFAFARSGRNSEAEAVWAALEGHAGTVPASSLAAHGLGSARAKADVERAVVLLNKGHYAKALPLAESAVEGGALDEVIVTLRGLAAIGICAVGLGLRPKFKTASTRELRLLEAVGGEGIRRARMRREIAALLAFEEYEAAEGLLATELGAAAGEDDLREAFLRQARVQLLLIRNKLPEASAALQALEAFADGKGLNKGLLNLVEQSYELALRQRESATLGARLREGLQAALERGDVRAQMTYFTFLARFQLLEGRGAEARTSILEALAICEKEAYGPDHVDCLFHAMGVGTALSDVRLFRDAVTRAGKLARRLDLHVKAACFEYVLSLTSPARERSGLPLVEILKFPKAGEEAFYYLDYYGFLKETCFEACIGGSWARLQERELRARILTREGAWWFEENSLLLKAHESGVVVIELARGSLLRELFLALVGSERGLSVEDVHALTSPAPYHPLRHASKVKTLIHRLRAALEPAGLAIASPRDAGRYVLQGKETVATVLPLKSA